MVPAATAAYVAAFLLGVVLRVALRWWRTGDSGLRPPRRLLTSVAGAAAVTLVGAWVLGGAALVVAWSGRLPRIEWPAWVGWSGVVLMVCAMPLLIGSQRRLGASWRVGVDPEERTELVTSGVYAVLRNPIYTALVLLQAGLFLAVPNAFAALALVGIVAAVELETRVVEEPYLRRVHGSAYVDYAARTGRFVPRPNWLSRRKETG